MVILNVVEISGSILSCIGVLYISLFKIQGPWIMTIATLLWLYFAWKNKHYWFFAQCIVLLIFNIIGIIKWSKQLGELK